LTAHCLIEDKEIADEAEWWLVQIIVLEHLKAIGGAMRALQGSALPVEGQLEKLEQQRGQIAKMQCITRRSGLDADSRVNSECDEWLLQSRHVLARLRPDMYFKMPKCQNVGDSEVGDPKLATRNTKIGEIVDYRRWGSAVVTPPLSYYSVAQFHPSN
jgi:hypothetical protein